MSEDKEREVIEQTRRNHSDVQAVTGNVRKIKRKGPSRGYGEFEVQSPVKAVGIILGTILGSYAVIYLIYKIIQLF